MKRLRLPLVLGLAGSLVLASTAAARPAAITGKLSKPGYTLIAIGYDGSAVSTRARSFKLRPRVGRVTLHLRDRRGKYAGPVLVARKGRRGVVGVRAGARLGRVRIARGYAGTARALPRRALDRGRTVQLRGGAPLGNGRNFGLVRSRGVGGIGPGADRDLDGVPGVLDIDDDGDRVLDPLERGASARASQTGPAPEPGFNNFSQLFLELDQTVNANAAAVTDARIDAAMTRFLSVIFLGVTPGTELDCGGLVWCSPGGPARANAEPWRDMAGKAFPGDLDADGDGLGTMELTERGEFRLHPNASSRQIGTGDTMIQRTPDGREVAGTLAFVFNTVPAIQRWSDGAGNGETLAHPVPAGAPGTGHNPLVIARDAAGEYVMTYTFWRPQRRAIASAGERGDFVDIGGLDYQVVVPNVPGTSSTGSPQCPADSLSTAEPQLTLGSGGAGGRFRDSAPDRAAARENTLTVTVNLSRCAALRGGSLQPGDQLNVDIAATPADPSAHDVANQNVFVRLG